MKVITWYNWLGLALILIGSILILIPVPISDDLRVASLPIMVVGLVLGLLGSKPKTG